MTMPYFTTFVLFNYQHRCNCLTTTLPTLPALSIQTRNLGIHGKFGTTRPTWHNCNNNKNTHNYCNNGRTCIPTIIMNRHRRIGLILVRLRTHNGTPTLEPILTSNDAFGRPVTSKTIHVLRPNGHAQYIPRAIPFTNLILPNPIILGTPSFSGTRASRRKLWLDQPCVCVCVCRM